MPHPIRPDSMRIDEPRCITCELCFLLAPVIGSQPERIPVTRDTLDAMAACPTGAIVWNDTQPDRLAAPPPRTERTR